MEDHRIISRDLDDRRIIAVVRADETDDASDDDIIDALLDWQKKPRHLRVVDDA